jgi:hypothetical protein
MDRGNAVRRIGLFAAVGVLDLRKGLTSIIGVTGNDRLQSPSDIAIAAVVIVAAVVLLVSFGDLLLR